MAHGASIQTVVCWK